MDADYATLRLLIADTDPDNQLLTGEQLEGLLILNNGDLRLAAAEALEAIAASEVLVSKKIRSQDLSTDGPAVSAELRALATALRDRVAAAEEDDIFDLVPQPSRWRPELADLRRSLLYPEVWGL